MSILILFVLIGFALAGLVLIVPSDQLAAILNNAAYNLTGITLMVIGIVMIACCIGFLFAKNNTSSKNYKKCVIISATAAICMIGLAIISKII